MKPDNLSIMNDKSQAMEKAIRIWNSFTLN